MTVEIDPGENIVIFRDQASERSIDRSSITVAAPIAKMRQVHQCGCLQGSQVDGT